MLIPIAKKVLKSINYLCKHSESTSSLDITMYFHNRTNHLDLLNTIQYLVDEEYITGSNKEIYWENIKPTYKGQHYNEFDVAELKKFLLNSFIIPILVSFFTALLTLWLNTL